MKRALLCSVALLAGCTSNGSVSVPASSSSSSSTQFASKLEALSLGRAHGSLTTPIQHVVIIVQENRSVDNLFNGLPGANTVQTGPAENGSTITLQPVNLVGTYDPSHSHGAWETEYNNGKMNGFSKEVVDQGKGEPKDCAYAYVPQSQVQPYWTMAETYAFADNMFATNEGPSFPAHLYLAAGNSAIDSTNTLYASEDAVLPHSAHPGGCDSLPGTTVALINPATNATAPPVFPCFEHQTIFNVLDAGGLSWKWYEARYGHGLWFAPDAYSNIRDSPDYKNVSAPNTNILTDIKNGKLPGVSWVMPTAPESDHANCTDGSGPAWVSEVVNAVGSSPYWSSTAIFVVWDEWGGWYDHVAPVQFNYYELGFRVPFIAISPYAVPGYVSHVQHEFGSTLKFIEENFNLGSLGTTDVRADDLSDMFNYSQPPVPYNVIPAAQVPASARNDTRVPDDDG
jgi:phospholipase C